MTLFTELIPSCIANVVSTHNANDCHSVLYSDLTLRLVNGVSNIWPVRTCFIYHTRLSFETIGEENPTQQLQELNYSRRGVVAPSMAKIYEFHCHADFAKSREMLISIFVMH